MKTKQIKIELCSCQMVSIHNLQAVEDGRKEASSDLATLIGPWRMRKTSRRGGGERLENLISMGNICRADGTGGLESERRFVFDRNEMKQGDTRSTSSTHRERQNAPLVMTNHGTATSWLTKYNRFSEYFNSKRPQGTMPRHIEVIDGSFKSLGLTREN